jgi:hypothetical protein
MNMNDDNSTGDAPRKSIIGAKYADRYKAKDKDWCANFIDAQVKIAAIKTKTVKETVDGEEITKTVEVAGKPMLDLDQLFKLCRMNNIDTASMEEQRDRKNAPGRIRMTLGNTLRAEAKHRHGLFDVTGEWHDAPESFLDGAEKTKTPDGSKIIVAKAVAAEATAETE